MRASAQCLMAVAFLAPVTACPALANDPANSQASSPLQDSLPLNVPAYLRQITDWGGLRSKLEQDGLKFTFTYYGDAFANPIGGVRQGLGYDGRFGTIIDADLDKLWGWSGATFHASIHQIHGTQFSATNLDNLMTVSGIEAPPSTRLFNLWLEQKFGSQVSLRFGQFTAAQEFLVSDNANLFLNATFGWPVLPAQDLPSGGPAYPEATPGIRLQFAPTDQLTLRAALFNGDPAGPGSGNPVDRDPFGLALRVNDPPFFIVELAYAYGQDKSDRPRENPNQEGYSPRRTHRASADGNLPGTIKIGAWFNAGTFADQRFNAQGGLLAVSGGPPLEHAGNYAIYGVLDQMLWRLPGGDRGLSVFLRGSAAPNDRNLIDLYADGGLTFKGPLASRPDDTAGIGIAFGRVSPQAAASDRDAIAATGMPMPVRDFEAAIELTYQCKLADNWFVQPDLQYIWHPGGNIPNPSSANGTSAIPNALVFGLRTMLRF
jgi:porin